MSGSTKRVAREPEVVRDALYRLMRWGECFVERTPITAETLWREFPAALQNAKEVLAAWDAAPDADSGRVAELERVQRTVAALRAPGQSMSSVPNTVRQAMADVIEEQRNEIAELERRIERALAHLATVKIGDRGGHDRARAILRGETP